MELKQRIAEVIATQIHDGDYLMLDSSSTAIQVAKAIKNRKNITLITNSLELLREATGQDGWHVISTGGTLKPDVLAHVGPHALRTVGAYHARYAILSCRGINEALGLADSDDEVVQVKQAMVASSDCAILLADHRKFDRTGFVALGKLDLVDKLITDTAPEPQWQERLAEAGVELLYGE